MYAQSREVVRAAMIALQSGIGGGAFLCSSLGGCGISGRSCPLLRIEIFRDFTQTTSLFFSNLYDDIVEESQTLSASLLRFSRKVFGGLSNFLAIDFAAALQSETFVTIGLMALVIAAGVAFGLSGWVVYVSLYGYRRSDDIRHGHESDSWKEIARRNKYKVKFTTLAITGLLSIYLPLSRSCLELLMSQQDSFLVSKLSSLSTDQQELKLGQVISLVLLVAFVIPLPFVFHRLIQNNKPTGSPENPDIVYDVDGHPIPFDDKTYHRMIENDADQLRCPYRSLYRGFERRWAYYKVVQLFFKLAMVVAVVVLSEGRSKAYVSFVVYGTLAAVSFYTTPFVDKTNDIMDAVGRVTALITCGGGILLVIFPENQVIEFIVGLIVNVANGINYVVMMMVFATGNKAIMKKIKNMRGRFTFSDTVLHIENGQLERIVPRWDLERESKHRIWHVFWEGILLKDCGDDVATRLLELQNATRNSGVENVRSHWNGQSDPRIAKMRRYCREHLEGIDIYWNDPISRDGHLDSNTCFGKMYIHPYPFHCVVVYDDADDESFIRDDDFVRFYELNTSHEILKKRTVRQKLRCISRWGGLVNLPFTRMETETVQDGTKTETYQDSEGNEQTREVPNYSTVSFTCRYTNGTIHVGANSDRKMAAGFNVSMTYHDGCGEARLPNTGRTHHFTGRTAVMGRDHIGLHDGMLETSTLSSIFNQKWDVLKFNMPQLIDEHNQYRKDMISRHEESNKVLGDGFWYFVFNDSSVSRESLTDYLRNQEINDVVRNIPDKHNAGLNYLYRRLAFVNLHPAIKLWYIFWDDFYDQNKEMKIVKEHDDDFDPSKSTSICYKVMKREDLEKWLDERDMIGFVPRFSTNVRLKPILFNERNLGVLYRELTKLQHPNLIEVKI